MYITRGVPRGMNSARVKLPQMVKWCSLYALPAGFAAANSNYSVTLELGL